MREVALGLARDKRVGRWPPLNSEIAFGWPILAGCFMQGWGLSTVLFPISIFHFPAKQGGACLRRDLSRREGVRRVRRASGGPGGRECAENPGPDGRSCVCCTRYSRKPGCGRN